MFERKKYNEEMDKVKERQIKEVTEYIEQYFNVNAHIRELSVYHEPSKEAMDKVLNMTIPTVGRDPKEVGDEIVNDILAYCTSIQHPRFLSLVGSGVSPYSIAGSILTDIYNPNAAGFSTSPCGTLIEEKLTKWMGSLAGWQGNNGGIFTSGGSLSNLTCMIAAREDKLPGRYDLANGVAFFSDQAHSSVVKGLRMLGLRDDQCIKIESTDDYKMDCVALEKAIQKEIKDGRKPFLIIGTIGTTNTGSIDPFNEMGDIAQKYNCWLHVDGAYGGSVLLSSIYKNLAKGIEKADSLSWDTHKWALQTYSCSAALAKDKQKFINAFNEHPEYLADVSVAEHNDGWDLGIEMSRPARYIKLWYTIQAMGTDLLADFIDYAFYNASQAEKLIETYPDWEIISRPSCGTLNFRFAPKDVDPSKYDELNARISKIINDSGFAYVLTTTLKGIKVIRLCVICGNVETEDVLATVNRLNEIALEIKNEYK